MIFLFISKGSWEHPEALVFCDEVCSLNSAKLPQYIGLGFHSVNRRGWREGWRVRGREGWICGSFVHLSHISCSGLFPLQHVNMYDKRISINRLLAYLFHIRKLHSFHPQSRCNSTNVAGIYQMNTGPYPRSNLSLWILYKHKHIESDRQVPNVCVL